MSKYFRIYPPNDARILFDGGKNSKYERSIIQDNESPDCQNVVFDNGAVATREGFTKLNTAAVGSFLGDGIYTRRTDAGAETMIVFAGGSAWQLGTTTFTTIGSAQSVFTAGVRVCAAQYENHMFAGNGNIVPYKWNGSDWTRHGVYPPTTTMTVATGAAGTPNGLYRYKQTMVNTQLVESDVGPVTSPITVVSAKVELTNIPVAPQSYGIAARKIYRTVTSGATYMLVGTISDNTTTVYTDNTTDSSLGATAPTDNGVPPNYSHILYHANRLFMVDRTTGFVWYTNLGEPYTVASTNFRRLGDASADMPYGLTVYDNSVMVLCEKSPWMIYMPDTDPDNWQDIRIKSAYGSKSPFAAVNFGDRVLFGAMSNDQFVGFAAISGNAIQPSATILTVSSAGSDILSDRIQPDMFQVTESLVGTISAIVYKNKIWITLPYGGSATVPNKVYQMDFSMSNLSKNQKESWVPFTGINASQFTVYGGNLYFQDARATGFVYRLENGTYSDDGSAIDSYFWTKEFSGFKNEVNYHKDFRYANLLIEKLGAYYMNMTRRVDSDSGPGTTSQIDLSPGGSLWGVMVWGEDDWGGGTDQAEYTLDLGTASGKRIQFKFSNQNTVSQGFKVHGMNYAYNLKGFR